MPTLIDFGDKAAWPSQLNGLVFNNSIAIAAEKKAVWENTQSGKAHYHFVAMPTYNRVKAELEEFLLGSTALAWHCTKLIDPDRFKNIGIQPFKVEYIKNIIGSDLKSYLGLNDQKKILRKIKEYEEDGFFESRENQIWFLLNKEMRSDSGCREFFEFFGGEALRRVIESELPEYCPVFQSIGNPFMVEFQVELSRIGSGQLSNLAKVLIDYGVNSFTGERIPFVEAEGNINDSISPNDILNLIPLDPL